MVVICCVLLHALSSNGLFIKNLSSRDSVYRAVAKQWVDTSQYSYYEIVKSTLLALKLMFGYFGITTLLEKKKKKTYEVNAHRGGTCCTSEDITCISIKLVRLL